MSQFDLRRLIAGESATERFCRILYVVSDEDHFDADDDRFDGVSTRPLLEPGARTVDWTCMVTGRAVVWHACLRPEDGVKEIVIRGKVFGKYPPGVDILGYMLYPAGEACIDGRHPERDESGAIKPSWLATYSPRRGAIGWHSGGIDHVTCVYEVVDRGNDVFTVYCIDGGQLANATPDQVVSAGTLTWDLVNGEVVERTTKAGERDDHCRRFVRTWTRRPDGRFDVVGGHGTTPNAKVQISMLAFVEGWPILTLPAERVDPPSSGPRSAPPPDYDKDADTLPSPSNPPPPPPPAPEPEPPPAAAKETTSPPPVPSGFAIVMMVLVGIASCAGISVAAGSCGEHGYPPPALDPPWTDAPMKVIAVDAGRDAALDQELDAEDEDVGAQMSAQPKPHPSFPQ